MAVIRTLVVDDNECWLTSLSNFLGRIPSIKLVGTAKEGYEALIKVTNLPTDLVIIDLVMPDIDGLEVAKRLKLKPNPPIVVIVTLFGNPAYRDLAYLAGADGYVEKAELYEKLPLLIQNLFPNPLV
jgi:DNA-binding NarL/FixJ family response regulator